jgi:hypothetical protein
VIAGVLQLEGRPLGGQDVLAFDPEGPVLLAAGATDDAGAFTLDALPGALLLGKVRTDDVVAVAVELAAAQPVELEPPTPFHRLSIQVEGAAPERLTAFLDPVRLEGVPDALLPFARQVRAGLFEAHYAQRSLPRGGLDLQLHEGRWRIGAHFSIPDGDPRPPAVVAGEARAGGEQLPGSPYAGFEIELTGDREVTLVLREDDE